MATLPVVTGEGQKLLAMPPAHRIEGALPRHEDGVRPIHHNPARFKAGSRSIWKGLPDAQWNDWHWQQRERITRLDQLEKVIEVTPGERQATVETDAEFHMGITPYYAALMDPKDPNCPIRL